MAAKIIISFNETARGDVEVLITFEGKGTATPKEIRNLMALRGLLEEALPQISAMVGAAQFMRLPPGQPADS